MEVREEQRSVLRRGLPILWRYVRMEPRVFATAVSGAALYAGALVLGTIVLGRVTDDVILPSVGEGRVAFATILSTGLLLLGLTLLRSVGVVVRRYFAGVTNYRVQVRLRKAVTDTYLAAPMSFHISHPTGELLAHADADVEAATEVLGPLPFTTGVISLIVFSVTALALIDPYVVLLGLTVFPALAFFNRFYTARIEGPSALVQERIGEVSSVAHESFDGALVVKTLGREQAEVGRMSEAADRLREARIEVGKLRALFEPTIDAIPTVGTIALLAIGSWRYSTGDLRPGELVSAMAIFGVLTFPMRVVGFFLEELPRSVVATERLDAVLEQGRADLAEGSGSSARHLPAGPLGLRVADVSFAYPGHEEHPVLGDISFELEPGEVVALVGPTGCGKSTLCQLIVHLLEPSAGGIVIGSEPVEGLDVTELRTRTAIVFQESFLFADTVGYNIVLDTGAPDSERDEAARIAQADGFIGELPEGFETVMGERGVSLSGGQRQRVALARALVREPGLLLLDDATSAVDPVVEARILDGLRGSLGATTLVVAHRVSTIELADRVVYMDAGRVIAVGTHAQLMDHPGYERLVSAYETEGIA